MGRKISAKTWAVRRNPNLLCEVCHKEPAWAFGWQAVDQPEPPADYWPMPLTTAEFLALPPTADQKDANPASGRLVGDCTSGKDFYDVTFMHFQEDPEMLNHVARKPWCNVLQWTTMIERANLKS